MAAADDVQDLKRRVTELEGLVRGLQANGYVVDHRVKIRSTDTYNGSYAKAGANSDITSLSAISTALSTGQGGTGTATGFTQGSVVFAGVSGVYSQSNSLQWDNVNNILSPTSVLLTAGTTSTYPFKFASGTNLTTAQAGAMEYDGTNLFFTRTGTTRESVLCGNSGAAAPATHAGSAFSNYYGSGITNVMGTPNSWGSVVIGGTTYKVPLYT